MSSRRAPPIPTLTARTTTHRRDRRRAARCPRFRSSCWVSRRRCSFRSRRARSSASFMSGGRVCCSASASPPGLFLGLGLFRSRVCSSASPLGLFLSLPPGPFLGSRRRACSSASRRAVPRPPRACSSASAGLVPRPLAGPVPQASRRACSSASRRACSLSLPPGLCRSAWRWA